MQSTITKEGKLATPKTTPQVKRKCTEISPEKMSSGESNVLAGNMQLTDIINIIQGSITSVLDEKLKNLSTKDDVVEIKQTMQDCCSQIGNLRMENEALREEVNTLKAERKKDHQDLMRLVERSKSKNVVFRGISNDGSLKEKIQELCTKKLEIPDINLKNVRKLYETDAKVCGVAEFLTEEMAVNVLKNSKKLAGTSIFVDKDLCEEKQQNKKVMLKLKKHLKTLDSNQKIIVRDDKMRVNNEWFYWNNDKILMNGNRNGKETLENIFKDKIIVKNICYNHLLNQKN